MMSRLYVCGAGNAEGVRLAVRINRVERRWNEIVVLDDDPGLAGGSVVGARIIGPFDLLAGAPPRSEVVNNVARTTARRRDSHQRISAFDVPFARLIDPGVDVVGAALADDCIVFQNATIGAGSVIGPGSIIFMGAAAGHGSQIGRGCILAPNAVVNARVRLAEGVYVGTNASILPDAVIGAWATVAANSSVMLSAVPDGATVIGVPGRVLITPGPDGPRERADLKPAHG